MDHHKPVHLQRDRGAVTNQNGRFEQFSHAAADDGWGSLDETPVSLATTLTVDAARSLINYNDSPDIPFDRSINPYRGCEHGCIYCFARPSHAWLGLSPGQDFESRLLYKPDAATLLRKELAHARYRCQPIALGINTDAYQPVEKKLGITRQILEVLAEHSHPVSIVTKSALIERDIDILTHMAQRKLVHVFVSVTTLKRDLARRMEPRAAAPQRRLQTIHALADAGIPAGVLAAPMIPVLNDAELEAILSAAQAAGARHAAYVLLRLPHEVRDLFREWLETHEPLKAAHVMSRVRDTRGGKDYDAEFGTRMTGSGEYAGLIGKRFQLAYKRLGFASPAPLDTTLFSPPRQGPQQMPLF